MNIAISGATGYIGKHLSNYLTNMGGHHIIPLGRSMFREDMSDHLIQTLVHCDVIINLAGAPISQRWTQEHKKEMYDSRINVTHRIVSALKDMESKPKLMISASAVGYYPSTDVTYEKRGESTSSEMMYDEYSKDRGEGFLAELCNAWEKEAQHCPQPIRLVITRFGIVLSPDGGAMQQMLMPLKMTKVAVSIGPGTQPFPWIDIRDLCRAMAFIIEQDSMQGVYNLVSPQQVSQYVFAHKMAKVYRALMTLVMPRVAFRLLYGEAASFLTTGQCVCPTRLLEAGFLFSVPTVEKVFEETDTLIKQL